MIGSQIPRIRIEPPRSDTDGDGAAQLMQAYSSPLDDWQKLVVDCWLGTDSNSNYTATSCGISVSRQNGKNFCIEARELYGLLVNGERILHTAHQVRTAKRSFRRLCGIFEDAKKHPELAKMVKSIRYAQGEEAIMLHNGGMIEFCARSRQAARGYDGISLVVFDEAQELLDEQVEAIMATLSASTTGTRQVIYAGTPPYPGCIGEVFRRFRQACITADGNGENLHSAWHEWGIAADDLEGIDLADKKLWYEANPALGVRLTLEFTEEEYRTLSPAGFARERLGFWAKPIEAESRETPAIPEEIWDGCMSQELRPEGKTAYGVKFSADGSEVVLAGAVIPATGSARISLLAREPVSMGLTWLANWLAPRYHQASCVVIDGRNGADLLIDKIRSVWVFKDSVIKPGTGDYIAAVSLLMNELNEQNVTWYAEQEELRDSAITATKRKIGTAWGLGGQNSAPIEACALALWGAKTSKRNPQRKMRLG